MRNVALLLALIAGFTILLAPAIYGTEDAPRVEETPAPGVSWICAQAFSDAAARVSAGTASSDVLDMAVRSCSSVEQWLTAARYRPEALAGASPRAFLEARCGDPATGLVGYATCHDLGDRVIKPRSGRISVRAPADGQRTHLEPGVGVEIILDTSGSMLGKVKGVRRIDIAKDSLRILIRDALAEGISVALRTFGGVQGAQGDRCQTQLTVPLAPLDREATLELVSRLGAEKKETKKTSSPIAASLAAVADDLAGVTGRRTVVLVTDGDETCGGDPLAEIARLRANGPELSLNVVGFALKDEELRARMADWAEAGGGAYFDASSTSELASAISSAITRNVPDAAGTLFRIIPEDGGRTLHGVVGGVPIEVKPGRYRVEVVLHPPIRLDVVRVQSGSTIELEVPSPA